MDEIVIVQFIDHVNNQKTDIEVDLSISAHEFFVAMNEAFGWGKNSTSSTECYLSSENPVALLRGSASLKSFGIREGSTIHYVRGL